MGKTVETTNKRILVAAIDILSESGLWSLTKRSVAQRAGVNDALVNYYFRSKAALIEAAVELAVDQVVGLMLQHLTDIEQNARQRLFGFAQFCAEGMQRYPGLMRFLLVDSHNLPELRQRALMQVAKIFRPIDELIGSSGTRRLFLYSLFGSFIFPDAVGSDMHGQKIDDALKLVPMEVEP
jgi:AcrR family transcriptional regulator